MTIYEYLMKAIQDDARRAGERDRLLREARRAHRARRQRVVPAAPASNGSSLLPGTLERRSHGWRWGSVASSRSRER